MSIEANQVARQLIQRNLNWTEEQLHIAVINSGYGSFTLAQARRIRQQQRDKATIAASKRKK